MKQFDGLGVLTHEDAGKIPLRHTSLAVEVFVYLVVSPLFIWDAKFCARLGGESNDPMRTRTRATAEKILQTDTLPGTEFC